MLSIRALLVLAFLFVSSANANMVGHDECLSLPGGKEFSNLIIEAHASDSTSDWMALWLAAGAGYVSITEHLLKKYEIHSDALENALRHAEEKGQCETSRVIQKTLLKRFKDRAASCWFCPSVED